MPHARAYPIIALATRTGARKTRKRDVPRRAPTPTATAPVDGGAHQVLPADTQTTACGHPSRTWMAPQCGVCRTLLCHECWERDGCVNCGWTHSGSLRVKLAGERRSLLLALWAMEQQMGASPARLAVIEALTASDTWPDDGAPPVPPGRPA